MDQVACEDKGATDGRPGRRRLAARSTDGLSPRGRVPAAGSIGTTEVCKLAGRRLPGETGGAPRADAPGAASVLALTAPLAEVGPPANRQGRALPDKAWERRMEAALRTTETRLQDAHATLEQRTRERDELWRNSQDLLCVADRNGVLLTVNPAWTRVLGWSESELVGRTSEWLEHPDDRVKTRAEVARLAAGSSTLAFENRLRTRDGDYRVLSWNAIPVDALHYGIGRDVTAEREGEAALRDQQALMRLALSGVGGVGIWTFDIPTDRYVCDAAVADLYGVDAARAAEGIERAAFLANVHPDDVEALRAMIAGGVLRAGDTELEYRIVHRDGSIRWVLSRGHTYVDATGRPARRMGIAIETTRQRLMEDQLHQSQKMELVGQLTGGIAHDFNNLLTVFRSSVDLLRRPNLSEERRQRYLDAIADTTARATRLTGQLLAFARRQTLKPEVFDVGADIARLGDMMRTLAGSRISIAAPMPAEPLFVIADPSQFDTALVNLAVNARDAMNGEGRLTITVEAAAAMSANAAHPAVAGDFVAVSVVDTGSGIAPGDLGRIFEPFFTTKPVGKGTGLGLSQVFGFVKQSGGEVGVTSVLGVGTTFTLYLPRTRQVRSDAHGERDPAALAEGHDTRVLVVDDNAEVGALATQMLAELGYRSVLAEDAAAALDVLARAPDRFDIVFSDVVMPGMNGIDLAKEIGRRHPRLPVVLVSGYSEVMAQRGAHGFALLHKPYSIEQLSRALRQAVRP